MLVSVDDTPLESSDLVIRLGILSELDIRVAPSGTQSILFLSTRDLHPTILGVKGSIQALRFLKQVK